MKRIIRKQVVLVLVLSLCLSLAACGDTLQLDSISPEASLRDIDTVDPCRSLYFSLCY